MGQAIDKLTFTAHDHHQFRLQLSRDLTALRHCLADPGFGQGEASIGAEMEVYLIDREARPSSCNTEIQAAMNDPQLTLELNRFNLEYNLSPATISQHPFRHTEQELLAALERMQQQASRMQARVLPIGILPTLELSDFDHRTMTDLPRYHALRAALKTQRDGLFRIDIHGEDQLSLATDDITLEGANTSFQVHYRVAPERFARLYNAMQLVTPLLVAVAANSPIVFGQRLWHESRVPLFKKSIDSRQEVRLGERQWQQPARVNFGHGWLRTGAFELFAEAARLYPALLPILPAVENDTNPVPALAALRLHMGTIWLWNRPVYDPAAGGHLRIEMRALPSGPSAIDMVANAALYIGLAEGLSEQIDELVTALPFRHATHNFYRAARDGLGANLIWPDPAQSCMDEHPASELLVDLLPTADAGLASIGISSEERRRYLGVIEARLRQQRSPARWQLDCLQICERYEARPQALRRMLQHYQTQSADNLPIAQWQLP